MSVSATASGFLSSLPAPKHVRSVVRDVDESDSAVAVPPYGQRKNFVIRSLNDFRGGGAYPEIHSLQFPLNMGKNGAEARRGGGSSVVIDQETGQVNYDATMYKRGVSGGKSGKEGAGGLEMVVHSNVTAMVPKLSHFDHIKPLPDDEELNETARRTQEALAKKMMGSKPDALSRGQQKAPEFVRYQPSQDGPTAGTGPKTRIIRMMEAPVDPFEPPKFKHKRAPAAPPEAPVPVMHSPPRKLTAKDAQDWNVPPCISNWKNHKGFTIPLDKRLAADGRGLEEATINDNFARLSEALYLAEQNARQEVEIRANIRNKIAAKEREKREEELRLLAQRARQERRGIDTAQDDEDEDEDVGEDVVAESPESEREPRRERDKSGSRDRRGSGRAHASDFMDGDDPDEHRRHRDRDRERGGGRDRRESREREREDESLRERNKLRSERRRERQRDLRMEAAGKKRAEEMGISQVGTGTHARTKAMRDLDRDVSEKVALGQNVAGGAAAGGGEMLYDQRLFNQSAGLNAGFGDDDAYNVYDKPLFAETSAQQLYKPTKVSSETYGNDDDYEKLVDGAKRFKADREFKGTGDVEDRDDSAAKDRGGPVQFEREQEEDAFARIDVDKDKGDKRDKRDREHRDREISPDGKRHKGKNEAEPEDDPYGFDEILRGSRK